MKWLVALSIGVLVGSVQKADTQSEINPPPSIFILNVSRSANDNELPSYNNLPPPPPPPPPYNVYLRPPNDQLKFANSYPPVYGNYPPPPPPPPSPYVYSKPSNVYVQPSMNYQRPPNTLPNNPPQSDSLSSSSSSSSKNSPWYVAILPNGPYDNSPNVPFNLKPNPSQKESDAVPESNSPSQTSSSEKSPFEIGTIVPDKADTPLTRVTFTPLQMLCSGSLVRTKFVITAASCVYNFLNQIEQIYVHVPVAKKEDDRYEYKSVAVRDIKVQDDYNDMTGVNDLAILVTKTEVYNYGVNNFIVKSRYIFKSFVPDLIDSKIFYWEYSNDLELNQYEASSTLVDLSECSSLRSKIYPDSYICIKRKRPGRYYLGSLDIGSPVTSDNMILGMYVGDEAFQKLAAHTYLNIEQYTSWIDDILNTYDY